jgi:surface antigen
VSIDFVKQQCYFKICNAFLRNFMKQIVTSFLISALVASSLTGCTNEAGQINKQSLVGVGGAIAGGAIGSNVGKGSGRTAAIIGGAILGGLLGSEIGKSLDRADYAYMDKTKNYALETNKVGMTSSWRNPDSGASGTFTPTRTYQSGGQYCREFNQTISVGGKTERAFGTACRMPDGSWQISN